MKKLKIGNIETDTPLVLAPMAGISDLPYRLINRKFGCGLAFTEMISSSALAYNNPNTAKKMATVPGDSPLGIQILSGDPEILKKALDKVLEYSFDLIDFNAACPVRKVASRGKGAGLMLEPVKFQGLLKIIVERSGIPVTVKIRSGWDETSVNAVEMAGRARDAGVSAVFLHGRTRQQRYSGRVDYPIIREVKESLDIPLIASGDALSPELIRRMFDETGCDGVAVARGALGNPWIFPETRELMEKGTLPPGPETGELVRVMKEHLRSSTAFNGEKLGVIQFRKFFSWYLRGLPARELKVKAFLAGSENEMMRMIDEVETFSRRNRQAAV